ncbi:hypothetical protein [Azohydromonas lata]|uniref:Uncharacterized protein n=1 Tax=Azohydromonas lata TaxID=45677 RepID=A0ABU5IIV7_9BURK|nr:hypothetical protein [Azohydromonas lata]MDZ5458645.1 hypothetical protein [Azohydromonas lata]
MHAFTRRQGLALAAAAFAARPSAAAAPAALRSWALGATQRRNGIRDSRGRLGVKEQFESWRFPRADANVRQIHGRRGEVRLPESGTEHLSRLPTS